MIRRVQLSLNEANPGKLDLLDQVMTESLRIMNSFIDYLWEQEKFTGKYVDLRDSDTWLSPTLQQILGNQALQKVKSQRKRKTKTKPVVKKPSLELNHNFLVFSEGINYFDFWIKFRCIGQKLKFNVPTKKHKHFHQFSKDSSWTMKKSGKLRKSKGKWFLDVYFEKPEPEKKSEGKSLGLDCGYKKLTACSDGQITGSDLEQTYEKLSRKKQGSKAFKKALKERDDLTNYHINQLDLSSISLLVVENLKDVKKNSKGKLCKSFNNKLQRWSYSKVLNKLSMICEEAGIEFRKINPAYSSKTCSRCGHFDEKSRKNESFVCNCCGFTLDADLNASRVILQRGIYGSSSTLNPVMG